MIHLFRVIFMVLFILLVFISFPPMKNFTKIEKKLVIGVVAVGSVITYLLVTFIAI